MAVETFSWIDGGGTEHLLDGSLGVYVLWGVHGRGLPPFGVSEDVIPMQPGSKLRRLITKPREVTLPLIVYGADTGDWASKLAAVLSWFNPVLGDGQLKVQNPNGTVRVLTCRYTGGLELEEDDSKSGPKHLLAAANLHAFDPYWYDLSATQITYTLGVATPATFFPFFPLRLTNSTIFAQPTFTRIGEADIWPQWTIVGPGQGPTLRNMTTGKVLQLSTALAAGDQVIINTAPNVKTVTSQNGANLYSQVVSPGAVSTFWPFTAGTNVISIEMGNAAAASYVTLAYKGKWMSPWS